MVKPGRLPLLMAIVACAPSLAQTPSFVENFNGPALDPAKWRIDLGPRKGAVNTERALSLRGGVLRITTFTENGVHHTGFIDTSGKFSQVTGRFEARLRFSPQPGMWSAFWSMSRTYGKSGDPDKADVDGVEIDIVEHLQAMGGSYDTTIHWGGYGAPNQRTVTQSNSPASPTNVGWHNYAAEWDKEGYRFYYDGDLVWTAPATVPNSRAPQHLIVSSEVLDGSWAGNVPAGGYGTLQSSQAWVEVDWVRAWPGPSSISPLASTAGSGPLAGRAPLTVDFKSGQSVDPDGTLASYAWNFSDGRTASGPEVTLTFPDPGLHTATLTVTDTAGNSDESQVTVSVGPRFPGNRTLHVGSGSSRWVSQRRSAVQAQATVRVLDSAGRPLPGALVEGTAEGLVTGVFTAMTDRAGNAVLSSPELDSTGRGTVILRIRGITLPGHTYQLTPGRLDTFTLRR